MEADTALVWAYGIVVLDAVAHIRLHVALVVNPVDAELYNAVGHTQTLDEVVAVELGVLVVLFLNGSKYLGNSLDILRLPGKFQLEFLDYFLCFHNLIFYWLFYWLVSMVICFTRFLLLPCKDNKKVRLSIIKRPKNKNLFVFE